LEIIVDIKNTVKQGSDAWKQMRAGKVTASRIADVIAKTKTGYSASRANYMTELVIQRFGVINDSFTSDAMQWGTETEPLARIEYENRNLVSVDQVDFVENKYIKMSGASPDGIVGDGLIEIKCPNSKTHFEYLLAGEVPEKYKPQMAWQMCCTNARWCDFVSYDPRVPEGLQYFQIRYERDDEYIAMLEDEVMKFLAEVDAMYNQLKDKLHGQTVQS
jgi:putative phage-type endonuclease